MPHTHTHTLCLASAAKICTQTDPNIALQELPRPSSKALQLSPLFLTASTTTKKGLGHKPPSVQHRLSLSPSGRISESDCNCQRQNNSSIFPHCITILLPACQLIAGLHSPHVSREMFRTSTPISRLLSRSSFS